MSQSNANTKKISSYNEKYSYILANQSAEPYVHRIVWDTIKTCPPGSCNGPTRRTCFLVECIVSGYGYVTINGKRHRIIPNTCLICLPGDEVFFEADEIEPRLSLWCLFGGTRVWDYLKRAGIDSEHPFAPPEKFETLLSILQDMHHKKLDSDLGSELIKTGCLYRLLGELCSGRNAVIQNTDVMHATTIMEKEYHLPITVSYIAEKMGLERSYFTKIFKEHMGISPYAYLNVLRVKKACDMLIVGELSVAEVAERVGLDPHNFADVFQRHMGITPTQYKKRASLHSNLLA